jgi:hypothetical protein
MNDTILIVLLFLSIVAMVSIAWEFRYKGQ